MTKGSGRNILPANLFPNQYLYWSNYYSLVQALRINFDNMTESLSQARRPLPDEAKRKFPRIVDDFEKTRASQLIMAIQDLETIAYEARIALKNAKEFFQEVANIEYKKAKKSCQVLS